MGRVGQEHLQRQGGHVYMPFEEPLVIPCMKALMSITKDMC